MVRYEDIVVQLDSNIERVLKRQATRENSRERGGFVSADGLVGPNSVSSASTLSYGYLVPESRFYHSQELLERILMVGDFGRRRRSSSGNYDLLSTNFDSSPDTGFITQSLAPVVKAARLQDDAGAAQIAESLGELIFTGAAGMVKGGFHTPNHRWVIVAALAMAQQLFPDLQVGDTIDAYLAESIDVNDDGEYIERSTGVYNAIVNRSLIYAAEALDRPELLNAVRKNLDLNYHLLHADATVVTSISQRQDQGSRSVPTTLADGFHALAHIDNNGFYASVADWLVERGGSALMCLSNFVGHPEWRSQHIEREPLRHSYAVIYPTSGLWRVRRDQTSATVAAGLTSPFSVVCGQAEMTVKMCSTFFATGQFVGEDFGGNEKRVRMRHKGRNVIYPEKEYIGGVYWLPINEKVDARNWQEVRGRRETYELAALEVVLEIEEVEGGFDLHIHTEGGQDGVPFQIECNFAASGVLETDSAIVQAVAGHTAFLKSGYAIYSLGEDTIRVGPGNAAHRMWEMRNSEVDARSFRLLITDMTPLERTLEVRCGRRVEAQGEMITGNCAGSIPAALARPSGPGEGRTLHANYPSGQTPT